MTDIKDFDKELEAVKQVLLTLEPLSDDQRKFVLKTVAERFGLIIPKNQNFEETSDSESTPLETEIQKSLENMTPKEFVKIKSPDSDVPLCDYNDETHVPNSLVCRAQEKRHVSRTEWQVRRSRNADRSSGQGQAAPTFSGVQAAHSS